MVLERRKVDCSLWIGGEPLAQMEEFECLGVLFKSEGRMAQSCSHAVVVLVCRGEEGGVGTLWICISLMHCDICSTICVCE